MFFLIFLSLRVFKSAESKESIRISLLKISPCEMLNDKNVNYIIKSGPQISPPKSSKDMTSMSSMAATALISRKATNERLIEIKRVEVCL